MINPWAKRNLADKHPRKKDDGLIRLCTIISLAIVSWIAALLIFYGGYIVIKSTFELLS